MLNQTTIVSRRGNGDVSHGIASRQPAPRIPGCGVCVTRFESYDKSLITKPRYDSRFSSLLITLPGNQMKVKETPLFFERGIVRLFGMWHEPVEQARTTAFIMCHPWGEEKLWSHRVFVSVARALAGKGFPTLRFDFMGAGDSDGSTRDTDLGTHLADLEAAVMQVRARHSLATSIGFVGLRFGATLAALLVERLEAMQGYPLRDSPLVLWDPVIDGAAYLQELLRSDLTTQLAIYGKVRENREALQERIRAGGVVAVDGYEIGEALFESVARPDLLPTTSRQHSGRVLVVQISPQEAAKLRVDQEALARSYARGAFRRVLEQPFWREIQPFYSRAERLEQLTLEWLEEPDVPR
jgi:exosortase A-associated hydrolase 2